MIFSIAGLAGAGAYSWATSVYSYNRDAWMTDIQILQNHDYQYDTMQIAAHTMSRDQVRDRTQATITKLNNYILVTTLIMALAAEMLVEGQIPKGTSDFVLNVYMLSLGSAILYLALGALFGVAASSIIYDGCRNLLTKKVPPPWEYIDNKMRDREEKKMTNAFERRPLKQIFMPPLLRRARAAARAGMEEMCLSGVRQHVNLQESASKAPDCRASASASTMATEDEEPARLESKMCARSEAELQDELQAISSEYELHWDSLEDNWKPLLKSSQNCVALGLHSLLEAYGYLCMATLYGDFGDAWAFWAVQVIFISLNVLFTMSIFEFGQQWWNLFAVVVGPCACAVAATTPWGWLDRVLVPVCYASHLALTFLFQPEVKLQGNPLVCSLQDDALSLEQVKRCLYEFLCCGVCKGEAAPAGSLLCDTYEPEDSESVESLQQMLPGFATRFSRVRSHKVGTLQLDENLEAGQVDGHAANLAKKVDRVSRVVFWGVQVVRLLWLFSVFWAIWKAYGGTGFKNNRAAWQHPFFTGPPVAYTRTVEVAWPSPFFRPRALVCPYKHVFIADEFRVWEMNHTTKKVRPYPCEVNGTIADISSDCDKSGQECWPVVLLKGAHPRVYDCKKQRLEALLQTEKEGDRFTTWKQNNLYVAHGRRVLQYGRRKRSDGTHIPGWAPKWEVVEVLSGGIDAMDVFLGKLMLFRSEDPRTPGAGSSVEILDLKTGKPCGLYELPPALVGAGCAQRSKDGNKHKLYMLVKSPAGGVALMNAELEATYADSEESDDEDDPHEDHPANTSRATQGAL